jgi:hypothetical protein
MSTIEYDATVYHSSQVFPVLPSHRRPTQIAQMNIPLTFRLTTTKVQDTGPYQCFTNCYTARPILVTVRTIQLPLHCNPYTPHFLPLKKKQFPRSHPIPVSHATHLRTYAISHRIRSAWRMQGNHARCACVRLGCEADRIMQGRAWHLCLYLRLYLCYVK